MILRIKITTSIIIYCLFTWYFKIPTIDAATIFIALCALVASIWSAKISRNHNELSVKPKLKFTHQILPQNAIHLCTINIKNVGIGPAILNNITITVNGQKIDLNDDKPIHKALELIFSKDYTKINIIHYRQMNIGTAIGVNEEFQYLYFSVPTSVAKSEVELKSILNRFDSFTIDYESFYGEKDKLLIIEFK